MMTRLGPVAQRAAIESDVAKRKQGKRQAKHQRSSYFGIEDLSRGNRDRPRVRRARLILGNHCASEESET